MIMIDRFITAMSLEKAETEQVFDTFKTMNPLPEGRLTVDTDHCLWIYIGPTDLFFNRILYHHLKWIATNYGTTRWRAHEFLDYEKYHFATTKALTEFFIISAVSQCIYSIVSHVWAGKTRHPRNYLYGGINLVFVVLGLVTGWHAMEQSFLIGPKIITRWAQEYGVEMLTNWVVMNIIAISAGFLFALPFHIFFYNYVTKLFFLEINHFDLTKNDD